jgi:hypothetical protein
MQFLRTSVQFPLSTFYFLLQMIFSSLVGGIFAELGLHVTNFDSVVSRFNEELSMKSFILIDEGLFLGNKVSIDIK